MTICVAIKVHDGVVFAADSAVDLTTPNPDGSPSVYNVWKHGLKVFNLHRSTVAMFAGMGSFGSVSISNLVKELHIQCKNGLGNASTVSDVTQKAHRFFHDEYQKWAHLWETRLSSGSEGMETTASTPKFGKSRS